MFFKGVGDAHWSIGRAVAGGLAILLLSLGDAAFDFTEVLHVIGKPRLVLGIEALGQITNALGHTIKDAEVVAQAGNSRFGGRAVAAEHALEQHARVQLHGIGRGRGAPGNRVHVGAGIVAAATAEFGRVILGGDFKGRESSILADFLGDDLVYSCATADLGAVRRFGTVQPHGVAEGVAILGDQGGAGHDVYTVAEGFDWL